ncbi:hypothetical protein ACFQ5N_01000 [Lutibacter holmesii]|uniref:Uncharacterized protein n=1 Tax=Lutibacter holmesii TaxID=1137985 RepID=A0ABW3WJT9_9FLAO
MKESKYYKTSNEYKQLKPFTDNPCSGDLDYTYIVFRISDAFSKLQDFSERKILSYDRFDFFGAFTELFFYTKIKGNYILKNLKRIEQYWKLIDEITHKFEKGTFKNLSAIGGYQEFSYNCSELVSVCWLMQKDFNEFLIFEELDNRDNKKGIEKIEIQSDLLDEEAEKKEILNPYPQIFLNGEIYNGFVEYVKKYIIDYYIDYSYLKKRLEHEKLIYKHTDNEFMEIIYKKLDLINKKQYEDYKAEKGKLYSLTKSENANRLNNFNIIFNE